MFSENALVVSTRKAIESTYIGLCTIVEMQDIEDTNHITKEVEVVVYENLKCRLSFEGSGSAVGNGINNTVSLSVKLFIAPEVDIKAGAKVLVLQSGENFEFNRGGEPIKRDTHQEVELTLVRRWA